MGDKYELIDQNDPNQLIPAAPNAPPGSPSADTTPLPDPEAELLKSAATDLYTKKMESGIYVGAIMLNIIVFCIGIAIGYYAL
ncbi:hypothetical protein QQG55_17820 [Brugia pahangi]|uniref:Syndecan n=1 Tax=Brugia pahangi TaxID=6280 RepID=A0A0N4T9U7_BRUPA|nr:unnamed protein product [Brugia pahangi]VDN87329.1 unnamed protein product [Brugia pahangi]